MNSSDYWPIDVAYVSQEWRVGGGFRDREKIHNAGPRNCARDHKKEGASSLGEARNKYRMSVEPGAATKNCLAGRLVISGSPSWSVVRPYITESM